MTELESKIEYTFRNPELLQTALTHSSYANERHAESLERLEFLGDSVLGFIAADMLYKHEPKISEGRMTKLRSEKVCSKGLSRSAERLKLGSYMHFSKGELKSGGPGKKKNLEDCMEALIGAIYLDSGIESARKFVVGFVIDGIDFDDLHLAIDNKSLLQEILQKDGDVDLRYEIISQTGPDHDRTFTARVLLSGKELGRGEGKSKKLAEEDAAGKALRGVERV